MTGFRLRDWGDGVVSGESSGVSVLSVRLGIITGVGGSGGTGSDACRRTVGRGRQTCNDMLVKLVVSCHWVGERGGEWMCALVVTTCVGDYVWFLD